MVSIAVSSSLKARYMQQMLVCFRFLLAIGLIRKNRLKRIIAVEVTFLYLKGFLSFSKFLLRTVSTMWNA